MSVWYNASICIRFHSLYIFVSARKRRDLALCIEDHVTLMQVVERIHDSRRNPSWTSFQEHFSDSISEVLNAHGLTAGVGFRRRGASVDEEPTCMFLRFNVHLNLDFTYTTNLVSPQYADLPSALQASARLWKARGERRWVAMDFAELSRVLGNLTSELIALHTESPQHRETIKEDVEKKRLLFLQTCETHALNRLQRLLRRQRRRIEAQETWKAREDERRHARERAAYHAELLKWDPHETSDQRSERLAQLKRPRLPSR